MWNRWGRKGRCLLGASSENRRKRLGWLDFGKAMGILVVLLVHAECSLGPASFYGGMFYMPVFFVAAGYTYRRKEESFGAFVKKKAVRLLFPYFGTSLFLWVFFWVKDSLLTGNPTDLNLPSIFGILYSRNQMYAASYPGENPVLMTLLNAPLWFLTAMFLTYVWYEWIRRRKNMRVWLAAGLTASVVWHYVSDLLLPWSLEAVPYFACFFAAGELLHRIDRITYLTEKGNRWKGLALLICFAALANLNGSVNLSIGNCGFSMLFYLAVGIAGSILVFLAGAYLERFCPPVMRPIETVGRQTLVILCFHMFLFMFIRTGAGLLGLPEGVTQALLVIGSLVPLTAAGEVLPSIFRHISGSVRHGQSSSI